LGTWFQTATVKEWQNDRLVIQAANPFILNHLQKNYLSTIAEVVEDIVGYPVEIQLTAQQGDSIAIFQPNTSLESELSPSNQLNPKYNFSRFVVGPTNRMAHAAALAVAELPGREFNPLFLCGGVGLGKTHLMQAIGHYRLELYPQSRVFYVSTEQFTNDLITAIRQDSMESFRNHYRHADILLVDDLQFIEGKEYTQEEFFHTFNTLHEAGKQVVLASDRLPKQMPSLQDRLISRFSMGLVISISGLPMTVENIAPVLNPPMAKIATSPEIIMAVVAEKFQLSIADLKGNSRRREISFARQIGMYLMRQHTDLSLPRIGEEFGGKDHTTVIYSCDKINLSQHQDRQLQEILAQLIERINSLSRNQ